MTAPRLVLVSAPAGSGKTTLVTQWLAPTSRGGPPAPARVLWLSLGPADDDVRPFLARLVGALQDAGPDLGGEAGRLLAGGADVPVDDVVAAVLDDLDAASGAGVVVLDDYHVVDALEVHAAVAFLLENLPPQVTVAMTTRADPPLPLARLRARGELIEIRAADLRFTAEEAGTFLNDVMGLGLDPDQVASLGARTEGWAAGLQLAALSAHGHAGRGDGSTRQTAAFIEAFTGSHRFVLDYLVQEVLDTLPSRLRTFLLDTAVLDELAGPLCDAVTGGDDGQELLEELERRNVFLVPLDDERTWFRYHHLFADALRSRARATNPDRVRRLHRAAADWHERHGVLAVAVDHALAAGDPGHVADLVELALPGARRRREDVRLRTWLNALPDDVLSGRALLATQMVPARLSAGDLDGAERWLELGETALARSRSVAPVRVPPGSPQRTRSLPATRSCAPCRRRRRCTARRSARDAVTSLGRWRTPAVPWTSPGRTTTSHGPAAPASWGWPPGRPATSPRRWTGSARRLAACGPQETSPTSSAPRSSWPTCGWHAGARRTHGSCTRRRWHGPGRAPVRSSGSPVTSTSVWPHCSASRTSSTPPRDTCGPRARSATGPRCRRTGTGGSVTTAGLLVSSGDLPGAVAMIDQAEEVYRPGYFPAVRPLPARRAHVHIAQGRLDLAEAWAHQNQVTVDDPPHFASEYEHLVLARLLVAQHRADPRSGTMEPAVGLLDRLVTAASAADRGGSVVEALVVRAQAHRAVGHLDAALEDLGRSLVAGVPAGYRRLFVDEGPILRELLRTAAARPGVAGAQEAALLLQPVRAAGSAPSGRSRVVAAGSPEALSTRELEVLRLLATDLTGPEIAERLYMSINTFRTHTRHIFTKLDVTTRRAAVTRAGVLGVVGTS